MGGGFMGALANDFIDTMDYPIMKFIKAEIVNKLKLAFRTNIEKYV